MLKIVEAVAFQLLQDRSSYIPIVRFGNLLFPLPQLLNRAPSQHTCSSHRPTEILKYSDIGPGSEKFVISFEV